MKKLCTVLFVYKVPKVNYLSHLMFIEVALTLTKLPSGDFIDS